MSIRIVAEAPFEAARRVDILPSGHRSRRLHGHSFKVRARATLDGDWVDFPGIEATALRRRLALCVEALDYCCLNDVLPIPTDENLARWIKTRLVEVPGLEDVGIQSTGDEGADIDANGRAHIWCRFRIEAAHQLPNVPEGHMCGRMHGHGFQVVLHAAQPLGEDDMGIDFDALREAWQPIREELHLRCLNDIDGLENPTSEMLAQWLWQRLKPEVAQLMRITVHESAGMACEFDGSFFSIWTDEDFEAAVRLRRSPDDDLRHRLHGHSYKLRLHLSAPLDTVMGWTVDYGHVQQVFDPIRQQLDHHRLDQLEGIDDGDTVSVLHWMHDRIGSQLPELARLDLYETPGCGAILTCSEGGSAASS